MAERAETSLLIRLIQRGQETPYAQVIVPERIVSHSERARETAFWGITRDVNQHGDPAPLGPPHARGSRAAAPRPRRLRARAAPSLPCAEPARRVAIAFRCIGTLGRTCDRRTPWGNGQTAAPRGADGLDWILVQHVRVGGAFRCAFDKAVDGELSSAANWDNETCHYGHT